MAINTLVQQLFRKEEYLWGRFDGRADKYMSYGLYLSGKGATVLDYIISTAVEIGMCSITNIFGGKHCLNKKRRSW